MGRSKPVILVIIFGAGVALWCARTSVVTKSSEQCAPSASQSPESYQAVAPTRIEWTTMGTSAALEFGPNTTDRDGMRIAAQKLFDDINNLLSAWSPTSELSKINEAAGTALRFKPSPSVSEIYADAFKIAKESGGAFNPLVGPVMRLWGFNGAAAPKRIPTDKEIADIPFSIDDIEWNDCAIRLAKSGMKLDLGGIAKGEAVDMLYNILSKQHHGEDVLIDIGGNLRVMGEARKGRDGWITAIRNPFSSSKFAAKMTLTEGEAVATSGNYERTVMISGKRHSHILDGRDGHPVSGTAGVTVIAPSAAIADGLSTTLFILGPKDGSAFLAKYYPEIAALWIPDTPDAPLIIATPTMAARLSNTTMPIEQIVPQSKATAE